MMVQNFRFTIGDFIGTCDVRVCTCTRMCVSVLCVHTRICLFEGGHSKYLYVVLKPYAY